MTKKHETIIVSNTTGAFGALNTSEVYIMKYAFITIALSTSLVACGHGHDDNTPQEPNKVEEQSPYLIPQNEQTGVPFAVPFAYEAPIDPVQMKYLNVGVTVQLPNTRWWVKF